MRDRYPFKFNVETLEYEAVAEYLTHLPPEKYLIGTVETVDGLNIEEWRAIKAEAARLDAEAAGDDHQIVDEDERARLLATDSKQLVEVTIHTLPARITRRLLNRIAIQAGVNNAGIERDSWSLRFQRGVSSYLIQFADKNDAIMFKLAMWKRPGEDAKP